MDKTKSVVFTGASSGIGRASVLQMSRVGWQVSATVRKPEDGEKLKIEGLPGVTGSSQEPGHHKHRGRS